MMSPGDYTTAEIMQLIQAYENGDKIEYLDGCGNWQSADAPSWNFAMMRYRIKPKNICVPFTNDDNIVGKVVQPIGSLNKCLITYQGSKGVTITIENKSHYISYDVLLKNYRFIIGNPTCGKFVQC